LAIETIEFIGDPTIKKLENYRKGYRKEVASFQEWGFVFRKWGFILDSGTIGDRSFLGFWGVGV